ncbi:MAG: hypothetical protein LC114_11390 [Bryobacterales bacterium]|nr:hypothetical protein [Bryobacterales bacterium]
MTDKTLWMTLLIVALAVNAAAQVPSGDVIPSVAAEVVIEQVKTSIDGNSLTHRTTGRFMRDKDQRTRFELGDQVTIFDPVAKQSIVLHLNKRTARVTSFANRPVDRRQPGPSDGGDSEVPVLEERTIEGYLASGKEYTTVIPVGSQLGNAKPIKRITRLWYSTLLKLPLLTTIADPFAGNTTTAYRNLVVGQNPDPRLFSVPDGFAVIHSNWDAKPLPAIVRNPHVP